MRCLVAAVLILSSTGLIAGPLQDAAAAQSRGDFKTALEILTPLAESGDVDALGNLGNMYAFGHGVPKDLAKAYSFWSRAAEKHLGTAMFNIAVLHATGQGGVPKDLSQAAAWYKKAAEHRHDQAMITLSSIYATGQGLEKNRRLAAAWASLASTNTKSEPLRNASLKQLRQLMDGMTPEELAQAQQTMYELAALMDANVARYRGGASSGAQTDKFNRFTAELPQTLETDAVTVMTVGLTYDFAAKLCARLGNATGSETADEVAAWQKRNNAFIRAATRALNELGNRHVPSGGEPAKQSYLQMIVRTTALEAKQRVMRQLNGANLDNAIVPPERACAGLTRMLRDGVADFEGNPQVTLALLAYMQRKPAD